MPSYMDNLGPAYGTVFSYNLAYRLRRKYMHPAELIAVKSKEALCPQTVDFAVASQSVKSRSA